MNIRNSALSLILGAYSVAGFAQAAKPSIKIGNHEIMIGLPADEVIASLRNDYYAQPDQSTTPHKRLISVQKNTLPIAAVYAKGNAVVGVGYMLRGRESDSAQEVLDALYLCVMRGVLWPRICPTAYRSTPSITSQLAAV